MDTIDLVIKKAELAASSPEAVAAFLKDMRHQCYQGASELEGSLLERQHPLIDLALAQYGHYPRVCRKLLFKGSETCNYGLRLAVLSNRFMDRSYGIYPNFLFEKREQLLNYLQYAESDEISALFQNPTIDDEFLRECLEGNDCWVALKKNDHWDQIEEPACQNAVQALIFNESIAACHDDADSHLRRRISSATIGAAWELAKRVPTSDGWACTLALLFNTLPTLASGCENSLDVTERWTLPSGASLEEEKDLNNRGYLSDYQKVRHGLAGLYLCRARKRYLPLFNGDDLPLRTAAYAFALLSPTEIQKAYERDGEIALQYLLENKGVWRSRRSRQALSSLVSEYDQQDPAIRFYTSRYSEALERHMQKHPDWFNPEELASITDAGGIAQEPATRSDINALAANINQLTNQLPNDVSLQEAVESLSGSINSQSRVLGEVKQHLKPNGTLLNAIIWISIGAVIGGLGARLI